MKKILLKSYLVLILSTFCAINAHAVVLSRIDVSGNQRMDDESVRILSEVKVGDNINSETVNDIAKRITL